VIIIQIYKKRRKKRSLVVFIWTQKGKRQKDKTAI